MDLLIPAESFEAWISEAVPYELKTTRSLVYLQNVGDLRMRWVPAERTLLYSHGVWNEEP